MAEEHVPMILDNVLWLPSTFPGTRWDRMKDDRKRMKAFGGLGMYDGSRAGFFERAFAVAANATVDLDDSGNVIDGDGGGDDLIETGNDAIS